MSGSHLNLSCVVKTQFDDVYIYQSLAVLVFQLEPMAQ